MSTKKTSSYKDGESGSTKDENKKSSTGRSEKYKKKDNPVKTHGHASDESKKDFKKKDFKKEGNRESRGIDKKASSKEKDKERKEFNPYLNRIAHKYIITCFVCEKRKKVAVEPFDGVPVICDECLVELEAKRLLDVGGYQKAKKLKCKWCDCDFYALNESYLFCDTCYDAFSHEIKARRRGLIAYNCKTCGKKGFIHPKTMEEKKKENDHPICRECMNKEAKDKELAKKKERINKVKGRKKPVTTPKEEE